MPEKVLLNETGKPLVLYAVEAAHNCQFVRNVVVATDSLLVANAVSGRAVVWLDADDDSWCGTQRTARALMGLPPRYVDDAHVIVSWQADEPEIQPDAVDNLIVHVSEFSHGFASDPVVWTMAAPLADPSFLTRTDVVKAITSQHPTENYTQVDDFSRMCGHAPNAKHHVGIYAMRPEQLAEMVELAPSVRSIGQSLEQLTWIDEGWAMATVHVANAPIAINTADDYREFCRYHKDKDDEQ